MRRDEQAIPRPRYAREDIPSVSLTETSFQKRFLSGFDPAESPRRFWAILMYSARSFLRATRSVGSEAAGKGAFGGGAGTIGCVRGVADFVAEVWRARCAVLGA